LVGREVREEGEVALRRLDGLDERLVDSGRENLQGRESDNGFARPEVRNPEA
jgi:hypothetical protein